MMRLALCLVWLSLAGLATAADYEQQVRPLLAKYCHTCHSTEKQEGELDLEQFVTLDSARQQPAIWEHVLEQLQIGEMPPADEPQPSPDEKALLVTWVQTTLDEIALAQAGDPGAVILRRLSNHEYTYTLRDLTGVDSLDPAREFPVDGAAGEGFTNVGAALVMSPSLLTKYLDAAKEVSEHAVLLPDGIRFSPSDSPADWTNENLSRIRQFYARYCTAKGATTVDLQGIRFNTNAGGRLPVEAYVAALHAERKALTAGTKTLDDAARQHNLNAKYMRRLWTMLHDERPSVLLDHLREKWRAGNLAASDIEVWQQALWRFTTVGHIGKKNGPTRWLEPVTPLTENRDSAATGPLADISLLAKDAELTNEQLAAAFHDFRQLFPIALCYAEIVPVDEVVTLHLFYREDDHLQRLMLSDADAAELDRLWDELSFVNETPHKQLAAFEQLYQYATQDADPSEFEPLREPLQQAATAFSKKMVEAEPYHVQAVIEFANRAWRRPLTDTDQAELRSLYAQLREQQLPHAAAVRTLLARVLVAPAFLYRGEQAVPGKTAAAVNQWELATRLSYFLWSSAPDAELRLEADFGKLNHPEVFAAQLRRMLRSDKVRRLATEFGCQWLHVRDLETLNEKSERHFPTFVALRGDMQEETTRFFTDLFQNDRSVLSLLDADHTFVNRALAEHYGMQVATDDWQRVEGMQAHGRGGILGFASTLAKQSGASRTSPILRGNWLSEVVLGEKLPRPPKGVPVLPDEAPVGLTERQLIERHSSDAKCASCHRRIDPFGFALEGFDAIGRLRQTDAGGQPIDTHTKLPDGTQIAGLADLRTYLVQQRRDDFLRQFCRKLLGYALGRSVQLSDKPLIDTMIAQLKANDYRVSVAIEQIVFSPQFREVRGQDFANNP